VAVLAGVEFTLDRGALVPPMVATVVAAAVVVGGGQARIAALLVAVVATATAWWCGANRLRARFAAALVVAGVAGLLAAELARELEGPRDSWGITGLAGALVFAFGAVAASSGRRRRAVALAWSTPLLATAGAWAALWASLGFAGAAVWTAAMAVAALGATWSGASPWRSRWTCRSRAPGPRALGALAVAASVAAVGAAITGTVVREHSVALAWGWLSSGAGEIVVVMTACGVRQWRFVPPARVRGLAVVTVAAVVLIAVVPGLVADGAWLGPAVVFVTVGAVLVEARVPRARSAEAAATRRQTEKR
jgi:hypothetical protein